MGAKKERNELAWQVLTLQKDVQRLVEACREVENREAAHLREIENQKRIAREAKLPLRREGCLDAVTRALGYLANPKLTREDVVQRLQMESNELKDGL